MDNLYNQKVIDANNVFDSRFMETKALYVYRFNILPSINFVNSIDGEKAFAAFKDNFAEFIIHLHTYRWYKPKNKKFQFDRTILILNNNCLVEFDVNYCEIVHDGKQDKFIAEVTALLMAHKERKKRQPCEINLIVQNAGSLDLKAMEIKKTKLDIDLFYEDDFKQVDDIIKKKIETKR